MVAAKLLMMSFCNDFPVANKHSADHGVDTGMAAGTGGEGEAAVEEGGMIHTVNNIP